MNTRSRIDFKAAADIGATLSAVFFVLWPWIMFGLFPPRIDGADYLNVYLGKWGLVSHTWSDQLGFMPVLTAGPSVFFAPLVFFIQNHWFFWIGSSAMATTAVAGIFLYRKVLRGLVSAPVAAVGLMLLSFHPFLNQMQYYWMTDWLYIVLLVWVLYKISLYLDRPTLGRAAVAGAWAFLVWLMRQQAILAVHLGVAAMFGQALWFGIRRKDLLALKKGVASALLFAAIPFILSVPFRWQNHRSFGSWSFNKALGSNCGLYFHNVAAFSPDNGPASKQLSDWSKELIEHPEKFKTYFDEAPPEYSGSADFTSADLRHLKGLLDKRSSVRQFFLTELKLTPETLNGIAGEELLKSFNGLLNEPDLYKRFTVQPSQFPREIDRMLEIAGTPGQGLEGSLLRTMNHALISAMSAGMLQRDSGVYFSWAHQVLEGEGQIHCHAAKNFYYMNNRDLLRSDDFSVSVTKEAFRAKPRMLVEYIFKKGRWYFTGISDNQAVWDPGFINDAVAQHDSTFRLVLKDGREMAFRPLGGLYFHWPRIYDVYKSARLSYAKFVTMVKKVTFVLLPLLIIIVFRRRPPLTRWFLSLAAVIHLSTGLILAVVMGHTVSRYATTLEIFSLLYFIFWVDLAWEGIHAFKGARPSQ